MKTKLLTLLIAFTGIFCSSQIWVNDLAQAKKIAKQTNKLIILDFNATWCKPCKMMQADYFDNAKYKESLDSFIAVPINIDLDKSTASYYNVNSIPNVKVIDYKGDVIHESLGYESASQSDKQFGGFPNNVQLLYDTLEFSDPKKATDEELLYVGSAYQGLIQMAKNNVAKDAFGDASNKYLGKCMRETKNPDYSEKASLTKAFNNVLLGSTKKAIKNIDLNKVTDANKAFAYYILINAHYEEKNTGEAERLYAELQKTGDENWIANADRLKAKYSK